MQGRLLSIFFQDFSSSLFFSSISFQEKTREKILKDDTLKNERDILKIIASNLDFDLLI